MRATRVQRQVRLPLEGGTAVQVHRSLILGGQSSSTLANMRPLSKSDMVTELRRVILQESPSDTERYQPMSGGDWADESLAAPRRFGPAWEDRRGANFSYDYPDDTRPYSELGKDEQLDRYFDCKMRDARRSAVVTNRYEQIFPSSRERDGQMASSRVFLEYGAFSKAKEAVQAILDACEGMAMDKVDQEMYANVTSRIAEGRAVDEQARKLHNAGQRILETSKERVAAAMRGPEEIYKLIEACGSAADKHAIEELRD